MYSWLWRKLPGGPALKTVLAVVLCAAVILMLMEVVFPWVSAQMPYNDVVV